MSNSYGALGGNARSPALCVCGIPSSGWSKQHPKCSCCREKKPAMSSGEGLIDAKTERQLLQRGRKIDSSDRLLVEVLQKRQLFLQASRPENFGNRLVKVDPEHEHAQGGRPHNSVDGLLEIKPDCQLWHRGRPHNSSDGVVEVVTKSLGVAGRPATHFQLWAG